MYDFIKIIKNHLNILRISKSFIELINLNKYEKFKYSKRI